MTLLSNVNVRHLPSNLIRWCRTPVPFVRHWDASRGFRFILAQVPSRTRRTTCSVALVAVLYLRLMQTSVRNRCKIRESRVLPAAAAAAAAAAATSRTCWTWRRPRESTSHYAASASVHVRSVRAREVNIVSLSIDRAGNVVLNAIDQIANATTTTPPKSDGVCTILDDVWSIQKPIYGI